MMGARPSSTASRPSALPSTARIVAAAVAALFAASAGSALAVAAEPGPRSHAEIDTAITPAELANPSARPVRIALIWGDKDHGPDQHDYPRFQAEWSAMLRTVPGITVSAAKNRPTADQWKTADLMVFYLASAWTDSDYAAMDGYLDRGGGALFIHQGVAIPGGGAKLSQRLGLASNGSAFGGKFEEGPLDLNPAQPNAHAITRGLAKSIHFDDEAYWLMLGDTASVQVLASTVKEGKPRPMLWVHAQGKGKAIGSILGHNYWTFNDPIYRLILLRSMAYLLGEPLGRFAPLVTRGLTLTGTTGIAGSEDSAHRIDKADKAVRPSSRRISRAGGADEAGAAKTVAADGRHEGPGIGIPVE